jgi:hypothetical protein
LNIMRLIASLILATVLAAFVASSVVHAAGSAGMAAEMVASGATVAEMADCEACGDGESGANGIACDFVCGAGGFAAVPAPVQTGSVFQETSEALGHTLPRDFRGLTSPPAKEPPRILI